jgi:hypothetical protein
MKSLLYSIVILSFAACTAKDALPLLDKAAFESGSKRQRKEWGKKRENNLIFNLIPQTKQPQ